MMWSKRIIQAGIAIACSWLPTHAWAQHTADTLKEVRVKGRHKLSSDMRLNEFSPGQKVQTIDSITLQRYQQQSIATLLSQQVPVFVRSYGFNGLATLSFRGASAAQSQVLWNGVPIQNAAMGIADISTLPVLFMNKVNIVYGSSGALYGSGNVGGALMLESDAPIFDSGRRQLSVSGGAGSFGQYSGGIKSSLSTKRWCLSANAFVQTAQNAFPYTTIAGASADMPNGHLQGLAGLLQAAYSIHPQQTLALSAWYQHYDREIPPALFEPYSVKKQADGSLRLLADWKKENNGNTWYAKASLIHDELRYNDSAVALSTDNGVFQYYQEAGWKKQLQRYGQILVFIPIQVSWMPASDTQRQTRIALAAAYDIKFIDDRLDVAVNARAEQINDKRIFLPGINASYMLTYWLKVRANVQRSYRTPTLNELYYDPGGNPSLRPEQGWNEDAGYAIRKHVGIFTLYHEGSVFNRNINDWIIWLGGAIWTPHNIATVHSRGAETDTKVIYTARNWSYSIGLNTSYVMATTTASYIPNDGSIGKQIPYTPRYNTRLHAGISYKRLSVDYTHAYTGYRFTTTDGSSFLTPYQTGNIQLLYTVAVSQHAIQLTAQCNNIWDARYTVVAERPMPGINWLAGIKVQL